MHLLNIVLFWIFFGFLTSYFAQKKGRNQRTWFIIGLCLGVIGVVLVLLMPQVQKRRTLKTPKKVVLTPMITPKNPALDKVWFYLDTERKQQGPFYFADFLKSWKKGEIKEDSFVWSEGMSEWKKIQELGDLFQEFTHN